MVQGGAVATSEVMAAGGQCRCRWWAGGCGGCEPKPSLASSAATSSRFRILDRPAMLCCLQREGRNGLLNRVNLGAGGVESVARRRAGNGAHVPANMSWEVVGVWLPR